MHCNILCVIVTCYNMFASVSRTPAPSQTWTRPLPNKPRPPLTSLELTIVGMPHSVVIMMIMHLNHTMFLPVPVKVPPEAKKYSAGFQPRLHEHHCIMSGGVGRSDPSEGANESEVEPQDAGNHSFCSFLVH